MARVMKVSRVISIALLLPFVFMAGIAAAGPLKIGILPVLDTLPLQVAAKDGLFAGHGLDVELVMFQSALERDTAMQAGQLNGYFGDLINTLLLIKSGVPMKIATISYRSMPGQSMFALVAAPGRSGSTLADAAGAGVGISRSTVMEWLLDSVLAKRGLPVDFLNRVDIKKIPVRMQLLMSGELDTALLPEPLASLAASKGGVVLATDEDLDLPLTVVCLSRAAAESSDVSVRFMAAYGEALANLEKNPEAYRGLMAEGCRIPGPLAAAFPVYRFPAPALPSAQEVSAVQSWMRGKGLLEQDIPYGDLVIAR